MSKHEAIARFSALGHDKQIAVLAYFGHEITISARGTYIPGTEDVADGPQLRRANEVLHRVLGQIRAIAEGDAKRYPDDVAVSMFWAASAECFQAALEQHDS